MCMVQVLSAVVRVTFYYYLTLEDVSEIFFRNVC
jgi:hypothetical protein